MSRWGLIVSLPVMLSGVLFAVWMYLRTKRIMDRIEQMLDDAATGIFTESSFAETRLSALETRFAVFLSQSAISARNVAAERDSVERLVADISHQTKTPLANLILHSELLMEEDLPEEARRDAEVVGEQAARLRFLIDSLVKLSRLENGILRLSPKCGCIGPMLRQMYEQFRPAAEAKGIRITVEDTELAAKFDAKWTGEALCNIFDNAIKYTKTGGITVSVQDYPLFTRIDIADTGIGIPEDEQAKIFLRFFRSEDADAQEGVGIGLYLAREIVMGEGGYIKVSSRYGYGSTFSVFLPK